MTRIRRLLRACRRFIECERDAMFDCCKNMATGAVDDPADREEIAKMDALLKRIERELARPKP